MLLGFVKIMHAGNRNPVGMKGAMNIDAGMRDASPIPVAVIHTDARMDRA